MFTKKQKLIVLTFFIFSLGFFILSSNNRVNLEKENKIIKIEDKSTEVEIKTKLKEDASIPPTHGVGGMLEKEDSSLSDENQVTVNVLGNDYWVLVEDGESVFDVMQKLANYSESNFSFEYKNYPSLGIFVEKINGVSGKPGAYWIYYVNNEEAKVGISKQILQSGDVITWKQE